VGGVNSTGGGMQFGSGSPPPRGKTSSMKSILYGDAPFDAEPASRHGKRQVDSLSLSLFLSHHTHSTSPVQWGALHKRVSGAAHRRNEPNESPSIVNIPRLIYRVLYGSTHNAACLPTAESKAEEIRTLTDTRGEAACGSTGQLGGAAQQVAAPFAVDYHMQPAAAYRPQVKPAPWAVDAEPENEAPYVASPSLLPSLSFILYHFTSPSP